MSVLPHAAPAGEWVTLETAFQHADGPTTVALQWELEIPAGALDLEGGPLTKAPLAVKEAGKSVNCAVSRKTAGSLVVTCILAGSQKPVPAGTVVLLSLKTGPGAQPGATRLRLQNAVGITSDLKQAPIDASESVLTIRAR